MKKLLELYCTFFRIGGLTFGGGMAMLPMLKREIVEKYGWATEEELLDIYAIGQCTPGVIAVNTSTYIGYQQGKLVGSIFATLGMISPSLIIISLIASKGIYGSSDRTPCACRYPYHSLRPDAQHRVFPDEKRDQRQTRRFTVFVRIFTRHVHSDPDDPARCVRRCHRNFCQT